MIVALTIAHIAIAAAWFGHKLLIPGDIRRSAGADGEQARGLACSRLRRAERFGVVTGLGTLLSGGALIWALGVETMDIGIWIGAGLVVAAIAAGAFFARPASRRLFSAIENGDRVGAAVAGAQVSRVLALESLLWVGALAAMVW